MTQSLSTPSNRFQIHLSTAFILMLSAATLLFLNIRHFHAGAIMDCLLLQLFVFWLCRRIAEEECPSVVLLSFASLPTFLAICIQLLAQIAVIQIGREPIMTDDPKQFGAVFELIYDAIPVVMLSMPLSLIVPSLIAIARSLLSGGKPRSVLTCLAATAASWLIFIASLWSDLQTTYWLLD